MICWYCRWGWPKQVADIYDRFEAIAGYDAMCYGPAHCTWADENFDREGVQSELDNLDEWCRQTADWDGSSASAALTRSLVNRLRVSMASHGSTWFQLTWKERATPSGRWIWARRASAHRTFGSGSGSCPSPCTPNGGRSMDPEKMTATVKTLDGKKHTVSLEHVAKFASWPTPNHNGTGPGTPGARWRAESSDRRDTGVLGHANDAGSQGRRVSDLGRADQRTPWAASDVIWCRDGKGRPVEPGTFPLAHGVSARVGRLRGYGNAIVPQVAAEVIRAYLGCYADGGWR